MPPKQCRTQKVSSKAGSTLDPTMVGWLVLVEAGRQQYALQNPIKTKLEYFPHTRAHSSISQTRKSSSTAAEKSGPAFSRINHSTRRFVAQVYVFGHQNQAHCRKAKYCCAEATDTTPACLEIPPRERGAEAGRSMAVKPPPTTWVLTRWRLPR